MEIHTVLGAGQVGTRLASLLAQQGQEVRLVSRRGVAPEGIKAISTDAADLDALQSAASGSDVIYNCINPAYHRWVQDWPPMSANIITTAQTQQAVLVTLSNLYGYGPVDAPMTEQTPLTAHTRKGAVRAQMWREALAAHEAGRIRAVEVRASDFVGDAGDQTNFGDRVIPKMRAGKAVSMMGKLDQPHTWTYTGDAATLLATVASRPDAWGKAWHVPSNAPRTQEQVVTDLAAELGVPVPKMRTLGAGMLRTAGVFNPTIRELVEMLYEFDRPFIMDSSAAQETFGLAPTQWDEVIAEIVRRNP
ncbi:MAG: NAD-dependent epimerase/dehydratase family protein [Candidatus Nanopelagicales bacterium]|jgi:nucleoside-diphosphate-sugar epimerase|nr:NAD-dependent epimerase/dehydratase family protein [Candidatus Nanopelagicales bacterium]